MSVIAPTVTAFDLQTFNNQVEFLGSFANRIHVDLMDGIFAPSVSPPLNAININQGLNWDLHLMYKEPYSQVAQILRLKPKLVIIHAEASLDFTEFASELHDNGIKVGLALLQDTFVSDVEHMLYLFDHVLVFSGNLGYHGGTADVTLLDKVRQIRSLSPATEIGWDGGINADNASELAENWIDVLNVGGYIQNSSDPIAAYNYLTKAVETK
jgi:ribulose-phosphate 3-epimerase